MEYHAPTLTSVLQTIIIVIKMPCVKIQLVVSTAFAALVIVVMDYRVPIQMNA